jgi:cytoskeletal protein CcmA (bactofilin family)
MWKWTRKDENKPAPIPSATPPVHSAPSQEPVHTVSTPQSVESFCPEATHIGKSIVIKGEVSGSENVYLDGELEGSVELIEGSLTVGPDGRIRANLRARSIVIQGRVDGNLYGLERVELKKSATFAGDIYTPHIAIEDGASLQGSVLVQQDILTLQTKTAGGKQ